MTQDRGKQRVLVEAVMNLRFPLNAGSFLTSYETMSFSREAVLHGVVSRDNFGSVVQVTENDGKRG
jgi:hypothetical protein